MDIGVDIDSGGVPMGHVQWFTRARLTELLLDTWRH
jgi:hypothetical protein